MNNLPIVAVIQTPQVAATVLRNGVFVSEPSDLHWGDRVSNNTIRPLEIRIPAQQLGQSDTLLVLDVGATVKLERLDFQSQAGTTHTITQVIAWTDEGVELYATDDLLASAVFTQGAYPVDGDTFSALMGTPLVLGNGFAPAVAGLLAVAGTAAIVNQDNNDQTTDTGNDTLFNPGGLLGLLQPPSSASSNPEPAPADSPTPMDAANASAISGQATSAANSLPLLPSLLQLLGSN